MSYRIFTDSSANLTDELIEKYDLDVLPLYFYSGDREFKSYEKGENNDLSKYYTILRKREKLSTSCVNSDTFKEFFTQALDKGEDVLYLGFSSALSGTYANGKSAAVELSALYPDRKIICVDTLAASLGEGLLVIQAAQQREAGRTIEQVAKNIEDAKLKLCHFFTVDDLWYLFRGGRVSRTSYYIANVAGIKPIMHTDNDGKLTGMDRVVGRKKSLTALADLVARHIVAPEQQTIAISHGDCLEDAMKLLGMLKDRISFHDCIINYVDPVVGAHSGPGTIAVFCVGDER